MSAKNVVNFNDSSLGRGLK